MNKKQLEEQIIKNYQNNEKMMILIFAQWCINNEMDPEELYKLAYPYQANNRALAEAMELTVPKIESDEISDQTVLHVLQLFGNDDLAMVVQSEIDKRKT
jgi:formaldehyde-activating enzyme involved in methanogenesis